MVTDLNWLLTARGGGHAVMDFYASLTPRHIQIEWDVQLIKPSEMGFRHSGDAMMRLCVVTHRNQQYPHNPFRWISYEDKLAPQDLVDANPTFIVLRDLRCNIASRLAMQAKCGSDDPRVNSAWLQIWCDLAVKAMLSDTAILYDKWFASRAYREAVMQKFINAGYPMKYHERQLNKICNPRFEASSFDGPSMFDKAQQMNVLFRDEEYGEPGIPKDALKLNAQLLDYFEFDREEYRK